MITVVLFLLGPLCVWEIPTHSDVHSNFIGRLTDVTAAGNERNKDAQ